MIFMYKLIWLFKTKIVFMIYGNVGRFSYIAKPIFVIGKSRISIGNKVRILPGARIEVLKGGKLIIDNNVSIGPNVNITVAKKVHICSGTTISANVFITDMDHDISVVNKSVMDLPNIVSMGTEIGKYCFIGAGTVILSGSKIQKNVVIGANSVVKGFFEESKIYAGSPARLLRDR